MSTTSGPNPLRPYYIPPANDYLLDTLHSATSTISKPQSTISFPSSSSSASPSSIFTSTARDLLSDLDYSDYIDGVAGAPSAKELITSLAAKVSMKYAFQGLSQPFEVAITNLQCQYIPKQNAVRRPKNVFTARKPKLGGGRYDEDKDEGVEFDDDTASVYSDDSEPAYFSSNVSDPASPSLQSQSQRSSRRITDRTGYVIDTPDVENIRPPWELQLYRSGNVWDVIKALWLKEGAWGVWKGQNASFIHWILTSTLESWTSSLLCAILSIPDPGVAEIADSPYPLLSIGVSVAASAITALALAPLDVVRTRLMITPSTHDSPPRTLLPHLRSLPYSPYYLCPPSLLFPTTLHASLPQFFITGKPYFIRTYLGVDPVSSPTSYALLSFLGTLASRFVRLPLETVLRRAQAGVAELQRTLVPVGRYAGVVGTMWLVVKEEEGGWGGMEGLFRGWRMEFWPEALLALVRLGGVGGGAGAEGF